MRIKRVEIDCCGPLAGIAWDPGMAEIVYDGNEQGKTSLADGIIAALFPANAFEGADRYGDTVTARVTVDRGGEEQTFPRKTKPRSLSDWLGWREAQLARLLCIRASELDLVVDRRSQFGRLLEALTELLSGAGGRLDRVADKIRGQANLTPGGDWTNAQPDFVRRGVDASLRRLQDLTAALKNALSLEAKEREAAETEAQRDSTAAELERVRGDLDRLDRLNTVRLYHEGTRAYEDAEDLRRAIDRDYGRYRAEDLDAWEKAEARLGHCSKLERDLKDLAKLDTDISRLAAEAEELKAKWEALEKELATEEERAQNTAQGLRDRLSALTEARAQAERKAASSRFLPVAAGVLALLGVVGVAAGVLQGSTGGWIAAGVFFALAVGAFVLHRLAGTAACRIAAMEEDLRQLWAESGVAIEPGEDFDGALGRWLRESLRAIAAKGEGPREAENAAIRRLAELRGQRQGSLTSVRSELDALSEVGWPEPPPLADADACLTLVRKLADSLKAELEDIRSRSGLATKEELAQKVSEKAEKEHQLDQKQTELRGKLGAASWDEVPAKLRELRAQLHPEELDPGISASLPGAEDLSRQRQELRQSQTRLRSELAELGGRLADLTRETEALRPALWRLGVHNAADVYRGIDDTREKLKESVRQRLAAIWAIRAVTELQASYHDTFDRVLTEGNNAASGILQSLTGRYTSVVLDRESKLFSVVEEDGTEFSESQLSDGARKQLLMAVRLALLRRLLGDEAGFLVLDDAFITFDDEGRKERAVTMLKGLAEQGWQILYFTADSTTRDLFEEILGTTPKRVTELVRA